MCRSYWLLVPIELLPKPTILPPLPEVVLYQASTLKFCGWLITVCPISLPVPSKSPAVLPPLVSTPGTPSVPPEYGPVLPCPDESVALAVPLASPSRQYAVGPSASTCWSYGASTLATVTAAE